MPHHSSPFGPGLNVACSQVAPAQPHEQADKNVGAPPATRQCARAKGTFDPHPPPIGKTVVRHQQDTTPRKATGGYVRHPGSFMWPVGKHHVPAVGSDPEAQPTTAGRFFSLSSIRNGGEGWGEEARFLGCSFGSPRRCLLSPALSSRDGKRGRRRARHRPCGAGGARDYLSFLTRTLERRPLWSYFSRRPGGRSSGVPSVKPPLDWK